MLKPPIITTLARALVNVIRLQLIAENRCPIGDYFDDGGLLC